MKNIAVIDLGTNTFHLLIVKVHGDHFEVITRQRKYVKLASGGSEHISEKAFRRGLDCMRKFSKALKDRSIDRYRAVATAALRTAENGSEFIQRVFEETGIGIELIDGFNEAGFIAKGVERALEYREADYLIMDIGGGSVEFIHVTDHRIGEIWSFPIGVAYLYARFNHANPITKAEILGIEGQLEDELSDLLNYMEPHEPFPLVGASGTFDVLGKMCSAPQLTAHVRTVRTSFVRDTYHRMIESTLDERYAMRDLPDDRADLIVVAMILLQFMLNRLPVLHLYVSEYALKEGVLISMMEEKEHV